MSQSYSIGKFIRRGFIVEALLAKKKESTGFGERLRALRSSAGLSQEALADRAGIRYQMVAKYERGVNEPSWATVVKLAKALGVDVSEFLPEG